MKILVVDHSVHIRFRLTRQLWAMPGIGQVIATADYLQALRLLKHMQPTMLVLDLDLPNCDPIRLIPQFKREYQDLMVAVLSNDATYYKRQRCLQAGADWFFDKSDEFELLLTQLRKLSDPKQLRDSS
ncbi:response regulator [Leptospira sp. SA-E8]|uniref:response regulator n=1 Tax=Leptospira sp. SA-E8 TaxID=3422259 RepID=UPI003EBC1730